MSTISTLGTGDAVRLLDVSEGTVFDCAPVEHLSTELMVVVTVGFVEVSLRVGAVGHRGPPKVPRYVCVGVLDTTGYILCTVKTMTMSLIYLSLTFIHIHKFDFGALIFSLY